MSQTILMDNIELGVNDLRVRRQVDVVHETYGLDSGIQETKLHQAVKSKQRDKVNQILQSSITEDVRKSIKDYFLLHSAAKDKQSDILNALLEFTNEELISQINGEGKTPLHLSVESKSVQCFEHLVQKSVKTLSIKDKSGNTPVHYLAKTSFVEACKIAVQYGNASHWNIINNKHEMPVHIAAMENSYQVLEMLLNNGARPDPKSRENRTPLHYACDNGYSKCVRIIMRSIADSDRKLEIINATTKSKSTPLIMAAAKGFRSCCLEIKEADPNLQDNNGQTALHYAARKGYLSVVNHLLEVNARLDILDRNEHSALYHAAYGSNEEVLDLLLDKAGNVDVENRLTVDDATVRKLLRVACKKNYVTCLKVLIKRYNVSALINDAPEGDSLLHMSIKKGNYKITKLLLDEGADKNICNNNKEYPLHSVAEQGKLPSRVDEHERLEVCKMILQNSHHLIHEVNNKNETPLHLAAKSGSLEMIHSLISKGGKVMDKNSENHTVVHVAAESGHQSGLKAILKEVNGARLKEISDMKPHPLHLAAENGHLECCKLIIKHLKMRHLAVENTDGLFPVDSAYKAKKFDTFRYLLNVMNVDHKLKSFCCRLHEYCEKSILEKRTVVFEAVINSPWFIVAFDGLYCANLNKPAYGLKPCQSFARLSKSYPEMACQLMDKFITKPANESVKEVHNYKPFEFIYYLEEGQGSFESPFDSASPHKLKPDCKELDDVMWGRDHPLVEASSREDHRVLTHKLTKSWMEHKFKSYTGYVLYSYVLVDLLTAIFVTVMFSLLWNANHLRDSFNMNYEFVCNRYNPDHPESYGRLRIYQSVMEQSSNCSEYCGNMTIESCNKYGSNENCLECSICAGYKLSLKSDSVIAFQLLSMIFVLFHLAIESKFIWIYYKRRNLFGCLGLLKPARLIFLTIILIPLSACDFQLGLRNVLQWQFGVIGVLVSWLCFISTMNKIPVLSIMMPFNYKFFSSYFKVVINIVLLLISFAVCFYFLLPQNEAFKNYDTALIKTLVWMLGDLGYDDTFLQGDLDYPILSNILFVVFILGIGSIAFNLLIRDSVDAIESIKEKSTFYQAYEILAVHLLIDDFFPYLRKKYAVSKNYTESNKKRPEYSASVFYKDLPIDVQRPKSMEESQQHDISCSDNHACDHESSENSQNNEILNLILKKLERQSVDIMELSSRIQNK